MQMQSEKCFQRNYHRNYFNVTMRKEWYAEAKKKKNSVDTRKL